MKDIKPILEFLKEIDNQKLIEELEKLKELDDDYMVAHKDIKKVNVEKQAELLKNIVKLYQFFQNDADINGIRVKNLIKELEKRAKKEKIKVNFSDLLW